MNARGVTRSEAKQNETRRSKITKGDFGKKSSQLVENDAKNIRISCFSGCDNWNVMHCENYGEYSKQ